MPEINMKFKPPKRGRPRKYTPEQLYTEFENYVLEMTSHPIELKETEEGYIGKSPINKTKTKTLPQLLTIADFCNYLGTTYSWWKELPDGDFLSVKTRIKTFLECYQLKGASSGAFNPNIVARLLGLTDKKEVTTGEGAIYIVESREQKDTLENLGTIGI